MKSRNVDALGLENAQKRSQGREGVGQSSKKGRFVVPSTNSVQAQMCRRKFLRFFADGFYDSQYLAWERDYKASAHERWQASLGELPSLVQARKYSEIANLAVRVESATNLLFSFEKMALRDALKSEAGAKAFSKGLHAWLYGAGTEEVKFEKWVVAVEGLPRKQTRVLTWPLVTVFGFLAEPKKHIFLKPMVTKTAARKYGFEWNYISRPNWGTYHELLQFARLIRSDTADLKPRDMIDLQSFIWVMGSEEYAE